MQSKYRIDRDTRTLILKYIRKYEEYRKWYEYERDKVICPSPIQADGMPKSGEMSNPTLIAAEKLERIEHEHKSKVIRAITEARNLIGADIIQTPQQEETLKQCIWLSCLNAKKYPFEIFKGIIFISRRQFYRCKNQFINEIKNRLGL